MPCSPECSSSRDHPRRSPVLASTSICCSTPVGAPMANPVTVLHPWRIDPSWRLMPLLWFCFCREPTNGHTKIHTTIHWWGRSRNLRVRYNHCCFPSIRRIKTDIPFPQPASVWRGRVIQRRWFLKTSTLLISLRHIESASKLTVPIYPGNVFVNTSLPL